MKVIRLTPLYLTCILAFAGCSSGPGDTPALGTVTGVLMIDGKPFENAEVYFNPVEGGRGSVGVTDKSGMYNLTYSSKELGAKVGQHQVSLGVHTTADLNDPNTPMNSATVKLPKGYAEIRKEVEVKAGKNTIDLSFP